MVRHEWETPQLVVQPVGGRTLVNFATNFFIEPLEIQTSPFAFEGHKVVVIAERSPTPGIGVTARGEDD